MEVTPAPAVAPAPSAPTAAPAPAASTAAPADAVAPAPPAPAPAAVPAPAPVLSPPAAAAPTAAVSPASPPPALVLSPSSSPEAKADAPLPPPPAVPPAAAPAPPSGDYFSLQVPQVQKAGHRKAVEFTPDERNMVALYRQEDDGPHFQRWLKPEAKPEVPVYHQAARPTFGSKVGVAWQRMVDWLTHRIFRRS